jgi:hypothetical protein
MRKISTDRLIGIVEEFIMMVIHADKYIYHWKVIDVKYSNCVIS